MARTPQPFSQDPKDDAAGTIRAADILDTEMNRWEEVWEVVNDAVGILAVDVSGWEEEMSVELTICEVRRAAGSFKPFTGTSADTLRPRHISFLSDVALGCLCRFFLKIMHLGEWPRVMRFVSLAMIPKPAGGWRLIGLLPALYRVWVKCYVHVSTSWWGSIMADRPYIRFGEKMAAQRARETFVILC